MQKIVGISIVIVLVVIVFITSKYAFGANSMTLVKIAIFIVLSTVTIASFPPKIEIIIPLLVIYSTFLFLLF